MTMQANALFVERYNSRVTHHYQPQGFLLSGTMQPESKFVGTKAYWPRYGTVEAADIVRHQDHALSNPDTDQISTDLKSWGVLLENSDFDGERMEVNEEDAAVQAAAAGMGRRADKNALDVIKAGAFTAGVNYYDASAAQLKPTDIQTVISNWFDTNDIPTDGQVFGLITMKAHQCLMVDETYSKSTWIGDDLPFKKMGRTTGRYWNFVNWIIVPASYLDGTTTKDLLLWHKPAVGGTSQVQGDIKTEWGRIVRRQSWEVMHKTSGANILILPKGVAKVRMKNDITVIVKP
jgi:Phage capsid protein